MSTLNDKLEKIIVDSGVYFYKDEIENEIKISDKLIEKNEIIQKVWGNLPNGARIAIYGLGFDSNYLFSKVDLTTKNVICMIDNYFDATTFKEYPVIKNEDIPKNNIDIVMITSSAYADEMDSAVKEVSPSCKILHMWDEVNAPYLYCEEDLRVLPIGCIYDALLLNASALSYRANHDFRYLLYCICRYLELRDFKNAFAFMEEYINVNHPGTDKILNLKNKLFNLFEEIKKTLASKHNPQTIVMISDAMRAQDISPGQTPFLYALGKDNIHCSNAYTHMGYTTPSLLAIFTQKNFFDNQLYKNTLLTGTEYFFEYLSKNNIDFKYYWPYVKSFCSDFTSLFINSQNGCADTIWQYLCSVFENDRKGLYFLHFFETHSPDICFYHEGKFNFRVNTYLDCLKYVDAQTEFLFNLLPTSAKLLFCSDHGCIRGHLNPQSQVENYKEQYNIPYIICDRMTHCETEERLISHLDTVDILLNLINDRQAFEDVKHREIAEINVEFLYSEWLLESLAEGHIKEFRAYKCFVSNKDLYVVFCDGEERYFLLTGDENLIDNADYADRINWFKQNVNTKFPDWDDDNGRYDVTRKHFDLNMKYEKGV